MGNATINAPYGGFQDPGLGKVFTGHKTTPITKLPPIAGPQGDEHTQGRLLVCAIAGVIVDLVLFLAAAFLLRRRQQHMVEIPEMPASIEPQEVQDCGIQELHDPKHVPELPTLPIELYGSIPKTSLTLEPLKNKGFDSINYNGWYVKKTESGNVLLILCYLERGLEGDYL